MTRKRVFLDTDVGCELDDQFAIAYAVRHPNLLVEGIGCSFFTREAASWQFVVQEDSPDVVRAEAEQMLDLLDRRDIPVYPGLRGRLRDATADDGAARAIVELAHAGPAALYVILIGAATNFARALELDPTIAPHISVTFIDGDYPWAPGVYNVPNDIEAFQAVLDADVEYLHVPAPSVTNELSVGLEHAARLFPTGDPVGEYLVRLLADWMTWHESAQWVMWDVGAIAAVARPELTDTSTDGAPLFEYDRADETTQRVTPRPHNPRRIRVVTGLDIEGIWSDYRRVMRLGAELRAWP